jgi:hypothetical protein
LNRVGRKCKIFFMLCPDDKWAKDLEDVVKKSRSTNTRILLINLNCNNIWRPPGLRERESKRERERESDRESERERVRERERERERGKRERKREGERERDKEPC